MTHNLTPEIQAKKQLECQQLTLNRDTIYTTESLMKLLAVGRRTIQNWRNNRIIEYSAVRGKFYYSGSAIMKMLDTHLVKSLGHEKE